MASPHLATCPVSSISGFPRRIRHGDDDRSDLTDKSVEYLISLDTLTDLRISDSQLTAYGLERLQAGLPKTTINTVRSGVTYTEQN